jgi:hypothetical protein
MDPALLFLPDPQRRRGDGKGADRKPKADMQAKVEAETTSTF